MSPEWKKFKLLAEQECMASCVTDDLLTPEIEMLKKLAGWVSNDANI